MRPSAVSTSFSERMTVKGIAWISDLDLIGLLLSCLVINLGLVRLMFWTSRTWRIRCLSSLISPGSRVWLGNYGHKVDPRGELLHDLDIERLNRGLWASQSISRRDTQVMQVLAVGLLLLAEIRLMLIPSIGEPTSDVYEFGGC